LSQKKIVKSIYGFYFPAPPFQNISHRIQTIFVRGTLLARCSRRQFVQSVSSAFCSATDNFKMSQGLHYRSDHPLDDTAADITVESDSRGSMESAGSPTDKQEPMRLIPWEDIWTSLRVARIRGNGEMIEVFYDTLFREAVFDDRGAWSLELKKGNS
jgi:hypothetical protein